MIPGTGKTSPPHDPARAAGEPLDSTCHDATRHDPPGYDPVVADDAAEIEAVLGRLPLARPTAALDRRVLVTLERHRPPPAWVRRARPVALAAAAAVAVAAGLGPALLRPPGRTVHVPPTDGRPQLAGSRPDAGTPLSGTGRDAGPFTAAGIGTGTEPGDAPGGDPTSGDPTSADSYPVALAGADSSGGGGADAAVRPINVERTFERVRDDGVVLVEGGTAYTRVHRQAVRRIVLVDPATGRQVLVTVPTSEVRVRKVEPF